MIKIKRNVSECSEATYDLVIVGGGIYGVMLSLEAARRNLRSLLLAKDDYSGATSLNHLRTVHGGLRYLQSLDLHRFKESVSERKWFLKYFPHYVNPLPCLMPLYGKGLHRNIILRAGLMLNDILSINRNVSVRKDKRLPFGRILSPGKTKEVFPMVSPEGLTGSARWHDAAIQEYQRLVTTLLKQAVNAGASVLNYVEAKELLKESNHITGIRAKDQETGKDYHFNAPVVINAAGPWSRDMAEQFDRDHAPLFQKRLLVWNILFDREALSDHALGISTKKGGGHTYFFHPWKNRLLVGTGEMVVEKSANETIVPDNEIEKFIDDMNKIVPGLNLAKNNIHRIYSGILPAREDGSMAKREVVFNHASQGGPEGLYSVSGVKFTTARLVAEKTLVRIFPETEPLHHDEIMNTPSQTAISFDYDWEPSNQEDMDLLKNIVENESVLHLSDLLLRRTSLADNPKRALKILPKLKPLFQWDDKKWNEEVELVKKKLTTN
ncbi:MAG: FAD-dependent oxidoreductase [bacterium]|nr:FAD-dependent oxidoreductase [bacterium]